MGARLWQMARKREREWDWESENIIPPVKSHNLANPSGFCLLSSVYMCLCIWALVLTVFSVSGLSASCHCTVLCLHTRGQSCVPSLKIMQQYWARVWCCCAKEYLQNTTHSTIQYVQCVVILSFWRFHSCLLHNLQSTCVCWTVRWGSFDTPTQASSRTSPPDLYFLKKARWLC